MNRVGTMLWPMWRMLPKMVLPTFISLFRIDFSLFRIDFTNLCLEIAHPFHLHLHTDPTNDDGLEHQVRRQLLER